MLVSNSKPILDPDKIKQGEYTTAAVSNALFESFSSQISSLSDSEKKQLKEQIHKNINRLMAVLVSNQSHNVTEFIAGKGLAEQKLQVAANFPNAAIEVLQASLLGNLKNKLPNPDTKLIVFYQYIPEIYEILTTHSVFDLRKELQSNLNQTVLKLLNRDMMDITLTDANTSTKVGWYVCSTLVKTGVNIVTSGIGGALIDSINGALRTHGPSIFDLNHIQVNVVDAEGNAGKATVRRDTDWNREYSTRDVIAQLTSDITTSVIQDGQKAVEAAPIQKIIEYFNESLSGTKANKLADSKGLTLLLMPIEILIQRVRSVEALTRRVILHVVELYVASGYDLSNLSHLHEMAKAAEVRLKHLKIHAYLTYLTQLSDDYIDVFNWHTLYKVVMAETLVENGETILKSNQVLSQKLWLELFENNYASGAKVPETAPVYTQDELDELESSLQSNSKCFTWSSKYQSALEGGAKKGNLKYFVENAQNSGLLAVTSNTKFGETSSLATLLNANLLYNDLNEKMRKHSKELIEKSDYIEFTKAVGVSDFAKEVWEQVGDDIDLGLHGV